MAADMDEARLREIEEEWCQPTGYCDHSPCLKCGADEWKKKCSRCTVSDLIAALRAERAQREEAEREYRLCEDENRAYEQAINGLEAERDALRAQLARLADTEGLAREIFRVGQMILGDEHAGWYEGLARAVQAWVREEGRR